MKDEKDNSTNVALILILLFIFVIYLAGFKYSKETLSYKSSNDLEFENRTWIIKKFDSIKKKVFPINNTSTDIRKDSLKKEDELGSVFEPMESPITTDELYPLIYNFPVDKLSNGAIIELHISQSFSEVFTITKENNNLQIREGDSNNEDIELWMTRDTFKQLKSSTDFKYIMKKLVNEGKITSKEKVSSFTLWRKGYKAFDVYL